MKYGLVEKINGLNCGNSMKKCVTIINGILKDETSKGILTNKEMIIVVKEYEVLLKQQMDDAYRSMRSLSK